MLMKYILVWWLAAHGASGQIWFDTESQCTEAGGQLQTQDASIRYSCIPSPITRVH